MKLASTINAPIFLSMKAWWSASMISTTAGGVRLEVPPPAASPCSEANKCGNSTLSSEAASAQQQALRLYHQ